ncbi:flagellar hook protein [Roseobacter sp. YSTF-M11]|uniref:Flagellar hook protein n=1 Tax=Roseobacter insulae TaxID=2859783 RepID=A0A9X1FT68_9RHOB|nr:flagellin [Roseobacter insulae]MBW4706997.1 flagellar hook protein [Roseobacter insulae]
MTSISLGDLAQSFMLQRRSVALRQDLSRLTDELSSGKVSDVRQVLDGNHNYLTDLERSLEVLDGYSVANSEAAYYTGAMQKALERVQEFGGALGLDLLLASGGPIGVVAGNPSDNARTQLQGMISSLNGDIAGRSLFAGTATDDVPLPDADVLIAQVLAVVAGQTTPEDIMTAAETWFADPAGFDTLTYSGSATALAPFALSETERVTLDVRANDAALKETLLHTTVAALADDPSLGLSVTQQSELFGLTGIGLQSNQDQLTSLRANIGFTEERIEMISARNQAEETSLEFARNALLATDPFETATELESVQFHLQSLYSVTVRSSQLSLVNFL